MQQNFGISAIGLAMPSQYLPLSELAKLRDVGELVQQNMAVCNANEDVVTLACSAAERALNAWSGNLAEIGLLIAATETAVDMSRPLSSWIMDKLNLSGNIRSYEVKHACFGGTAAIRQAIEWQLSGAARGRVALVVCADIAEYEHMHSGEPTQGAGAVAFVIGPATLAVIQADSYAWSQPQFDFWRPVGEAYPRVNARLSLISFIKAAENCVAQLGSQTEIRNFVMNHRYFCMHTPFPKLVAKAWQAVAKLAGFSSAETDDLFKQKVVPTMSWNKQLGNSYTANVWFALSLALSISAVDDNIAVFSYGSGCGAELLSLTAVNLNKTCYWPQQFEQDLTARQAISVETYMRNRNLTVSKEYA